MKSTLKRAAAALAVAVSVAGSAEAGPILLIEDQGGFGSASSVLMCKGFTVTAIGNEFVNGFPTLLDGAFLNGFDMVVYGERGIGSGGQMSAAVRASLEGYVQQGGHLLVTGYDTLGSPTDPELAALLRVALPGDLNSTDPSWNVANLDHPIINGPFGNFQGVSFDAQGYDDDEFELGAGTIALVTMDNNQVRLALNDLPGAAGSVGYWNGGVSGTTTNAQPDFSSGGGPESVFLNWACWATGCSAAQVAEPSTLGIASLALALGVCTSRTRRTP